MSLLITSSSEGAGQTNQIGISVPYQFRNNLKNPLIIEPLSEIAVESVKLNRMPQIDYEGSMVANLWFGERLAQDGDLENSLSYFIPCENTIDQGVSPLDFTEKFKKILQENYSCHPEIDSQNIDVNLVLDGAGGLTGFQFLIPVLGGVPAASTIPSAATRTQEDTEVSDPEGELGWDGTTLEADLDIGGDEDAGVLGQLQPINDQGGPLSLNNGSLTYGNRQATGGYTLGCSRPLCVKQSGPDELQLFSQDAGPLFGAEDFSANGIGPHDMGYMDYCAQDNGDGFVRLYHSVCDGVGIGSGPRTIMEEIKYYQKTASEFESNNVDNSSFATGTPQLSSKVPEITFRANGERMDILFGASIAAAAISVNASTKSQIPKPIGQTAWKMYPTVYLWTNLDTVDITRYECRTGTTIYNNQPENSWVTRCTIPTFLGNGTALDHRNLTSAATVTPTPPWNNALSWPNSVDFRPAYQILDAASKNTSALTGLRTRKVISASNIDNYETIIIAGPSERYMPRRIQEWQPNSMEALGFSPFAINPLNTQVTAFGCSFASPTRPSMMSQHSTFVRVPTLTHETYNFGTGNPSKILYQVPRFDNAGTETGALYFQNPDKTFIDLNNTTELRVTDLDVHMVRKDERFAKDLTGSTEVVFHVRKKQKL